MFGHVWSRTKRGAEVTGRVLESSVGRSARDAVPAAESHGPRVDFTSLPSVYPSALFGSLNGDRSVRRCARCRHRGLQNRAVKRRRENDRWQIAQTIVCVCFSDVVCPKRSIILFLVIRAGVWETWLAARAVPGSSPPATCSSSRSPSFASSVVRSAKLVALIVRSRFVGVGVLALASGARLSIALAA
jgi:hypothetical protein